MGVLSGVSSVHLPICMLQNRDPFELLDGQKLSLAFIQMDMYGNVVWFNGMLFH